MATADFIDTLADRVVLGDGAMGTLLSERGWITDGCPEALLLAQSERIEQIHREYLDAGSRLIRTNSFGANARQLAQCGLDRRVSEINWKAAQVAKSAAKGRDAWIAGSVGPLGLTAEESTAGQVDREALFREQIGALLDGGAQIIFLESFHDLSELLAALHVTRSLHHCPVICSMGFSEEGNTLRGVSVTDAYEKLTSEGVEVVGANCSVGPQGMLTVLKRFPRRKDVSLAAFPNGSRPQFIEGRFRFLAKPEYFAQRGHELAEAGVRLIGGCCGTNPEHIRALRDLLATEPVRVLAQVREPAVKPEREPRETGEHEETILDIYARGTLIVTELDPPKTLELDRMFEGARVLKDAGNDALTLADNSLAIMRVSNVAIAHLLEQRLGIRPLVHLACRDRNLIGVQSELLGMYALGMHHVLALTGDPAKTGDHPGASSVYDLNSVSLIQMIARMNEGWTLSGRNLKRRTRFVIGCSFNPNVNNLDIQLKRLERKLEAGAQFVMTQPIFDPRQAAKIHAATRAFGVPILVGVMPLLHSRNAEFLHNEVPGISIPDEVRERIRGKEGAEGEKIGLEVARQVAGELLSHFRGVYLITPFLRYELTAQLCRWVRASQPAAAAARAGA